MMWGNHGFWGSGWGWPVFAIMAVAMIAGMVMMGRMMMRHGTSPSTGENSTSRPTRETGNRVEETPGQILERRLASGEIDVEEFQRLRDVLQSARTSPADAAEPSGAGPSSPGA
jgi:putative membrane protein